MLYCNQFRFNGWNAIKLVVILFIPNVCVLLWTKTANWTFKFITSSVMID